MATEVAGDFDTPSLLGVWNGAENAIGADPIWQDSQ